MRRKGFGADNEIVLDGVSMALHGEQRKEISPLQRIARPLLSIVSKMAASRLKTTPASIFLDVAAALPQPRE